MEALFDNEQIDISSLPKAEEVNWIPLNKKYLPISLLSAWIFGAILCGIFLFVNILNSDLIEENWKIAAVIGSIVFFFVIISFLSVLGFRHKAYALREHDVLYKSGLIFRKTTALPFNRVQHSEISQGPIERNFNLAKLQVFTAGGQSSDMVIPGLLNEDAQNIKTYIMEKTAQHD